jgi:hypothetical protein
MARGWESKSVEDQQAQASEKSTPHRPTLTPEQASRQREKDGLVLSRQRVLQQLEATTDIRKRGLWEQALAALNQKITKLS